MSHSPRILSIQSHLEGTDLQRHVESRYHGPLPVFASLRNATVKAGCVRIHLVCVERNGVLYLVTS